jgi:hypothetical protein
MDEYREANENKSCDACGRETVRARHARSLHEARGILGACRPMTVYRNLADVLARYDRVEQKREASLIRHYCLNDLFYLHTVGCRRVDLQHQWFLDRCDEVQGAPDGYLDLWAREHGKSSIITFGLTLQDILNNPEITIGIFSHTRPMAKAFLRVVKREMENNDVLKGLFPDILWTQPEKEAPTWSGRRARGQAPGQSQGDDRRGVGPGRWYAHGQAL